MNTIDYIVLVIALWALWRGWRRGLVRQIGALVALMLGVWLAIRYAAEVGAWLHLDASVQTAGGFVAVLLVVIAAITVVAILLKKGFKVAGLGTFDNLLGAVVSLLKALLAVGLLLSSFETLNRKYRLVEPQTLHASYTCDPLVQTTQRLFPAMQEWAKQLPDMIPESKSHGDDNQ